LNLVFKQGQGWYISPYNCNGVLVCALELLLRVRWHQTLTGEAKTWVWN